MAIFGFVMATFQGQIAFYQCLILCLLPTRLMSASHAYEFAVLRVTHSVARSQQIYSKTTILILSLGYIYNLFVLSVTLYNAIPVFLKLVVKFGIK